MPHARTSRRRKRPPEASVDHDARRARDIEISHEIHKLGVAHKNCLVLEASIAMLEANLNFLVNPAIAKVTKALRRELRRESAAYSRQLCRIRSL